MPSKSSKKNLRLLGKDKKSTAATASEGEARSSPHQDVLRQSRNAVFDRYYGEQQNLGAYVLQIASARQRGGQPVVDRAAEVAKAAADAAWEGEVARFRTPLPTTIWINDTDPIAPSVSAHFQSFATCQKDAGSEAGEGAAVVQPIPWYPLEGMAWRVMADRTSFRKRPDLAPLRNYLIQQTAMGTVSRQEEVSMIPPLLLDLQPTDVALDMCASPGSKTAQMLVALGRHKRTPGGPFPFDYLSEGLIMANELDSKRANMLVYQVKRLRLLFPFALFTNHDARYFPDLPSLSPSSSSSSASGAGEPTAQQFDKILCDVVCSGDGTLRKAPHAFRTWSPREAMGLQRTQVQIALRAAHLLRVGGRLVYSTCSLNPIENEAVVARLVHLTGGALRLLPSGPLMTALLPDLPYAPGMTTWTVTDAKGATAAGPTEGLHEALFPPGTPGGYASAATRELDLAQCMRFFPSCCEGGGFFIAVFEKVGEFAITKREVEEGEGGEEEGEPREEGKRGAKRPRTETVKEGEAVAEGTKPRQPAPQYAPAPAAIVEALSSFYRIDTTVFPVANLVARVPQGEAVMRLTASTAVSLVSNTALRVLQRKSPRLVVVAAGLRVLATESLDGGWRIAAEAAPLYPAFLRDSPRRIAGVPVALVDRMVREGGRLKEVAIDAVEPAELRARLEAAPLGALLLEVDCPGADGGDVLYTVALRARTRVALLVDHEDVVGLQLRLGLPVAVEQQQQQQQQGSVGEDN